MADENGVLKCGLGGVNNPDVPNGNVSIRTPLSPRRISARSLIRDACVAVGRTVFATRFDTAEAFYGARVPRQPRRH